jgi:hypothetical protein
MFITGSEAITSYILKNCHDTHHNFTKWTLQPGTASFFLTPDDTFTHTLRLLGLLFEQLLPTNNINNANQINPLSTYVQNHTDRPFCQVVPHPYFWANLHNHKRLWEITDHLIKAFQTHSQWKLHHSHITDSTETDTHASSALASVSPTMAPFHDTPPRTIGTAPTTAKGPPPVVVPAATFRKAAPPKPPVPSFAG